MDTSSLMAITSAAGVASSVASGVAQYRMGKAEQGAYQYNADVTLEEMKEAQQTSAAKYQALMGRQRALYAKAGVDISSGSPLLIAMDTAMQGETERQRIEYSGTTQADILKYYGAMAKYSGKIGGMSTFLTGLQRGGAGYMYATKGADSTTSQYSDYQMANYLYGPG